MRRIDDNREDDRQRGGKPETERSGLGDGCCRIGSRRVSSAARPAWGERSEKRGHAIEGRWHSVTQRPVRRDMRAASRLAGVSDGPDWRTGAGWIVWLGMAAYFITLAKCAWLSDDYFITLRQVEQLFAGHGIRFNLYERSFLSTSVAYFFISSISGSRCPLRLMPRCRTPMVSYIGWRRRGTTIASRCTRTASCWP